MLKSVSAIACEDTRTSSHLLQNYGITTPAISFHQHNEHRKVEQIIGKLDSGQNIAIISDAGTPGISDPGFLAARMAHQRGHTVCAIPGASAAITALAASGLPSDRFLFEGFLPARKGRSTRLDTVVEQDCTVILFESVHRIVRLLEELHKRAGDDRMVAVCRELTKMFEEVIRKKLISRASAGADLCPEWHEADIYDHYFTQLHGRIDATSSLEQRIAFFERARQDLCDNYVYTSLPDDVDGGGAGATRLVPEPRRLAEVMRLSQLLDRMYAIQPNKLALQAPRSGMTLRAPDYFAPRPMYCGLPTRRINYNQ